MASSFPEGATPDTGVPAPVNPVLVPPLADAGAWDRKMLYLRWSCERLEALLDKENERWIRLEEKTAQAFAAAAGSAVLALGSIPPPLGRAAPLAFLGTGAIVAAVFFAYRTLSVSEMPAGNPESLRVDDAAPTSEDWLTRTNRYRLHLVESVLQSRRMGKDRGRSLKLTQFCSLAAILSMIGCILVRAITTR